MERCAKLFLTLYLDVLLTLVLNSFLRQLISVQKIFIGHLVYARLVVGRVQKWIR
jgi:hypothetical protein